MGALCLTPSPLTGEGWGEGEEGLIATYRALTTPLPVGRQHPSLHLAGLRSGIQARGAATTQTQETIKRTRTPTPCVGASLVGARWGGARQLTRRHFVVGRGHAQTASTLVPIGYSRLYFVLPDSDPVPTVVDGGARLPPKHTNPTKTPHPNTPPFVLPDSDPVSTVGGLRGAAPTLNRPSHTPHRHPNMSFLSEAKNLPVVPRQTPSPINRPHRPTGKKSATRPTAN